MIQKYRELSLLLIDLGNSIGFIDNFPEILRKKEGIPVSASFDKSQCLYINLLHHEMYTKLSQSPHLLREMLTGKPAEFVVVIDEIQRVPLILNEVHSLIESQGIRFLLTGSSAYSLRQKGVNLLAGRAWEAQLYPLTWSELGLHSNLTRYLRFGGLPSVYLSDDPDEELQSYVHTYLREEIRAESLLRNITAFSTFLKIAALSSGQVLNFANISSDLGISASTIKEYYQLLQDTFLGFLLPAWSKSVKRKPTSKAKFYLFDMGVRNTLAQIRHIDPKSDLYGQAFEHFIILEVRAYLSYRRIREEMAYWASTHGEEVDLIVGDRWAIEIKATEKVSDKHLKNLKKLREEGICERYLCISSDPLTRVADEIELYFWEDFLKELWSDRLIRQN